MNLFRKKNKERQFLDIQKVRRGWDSFFLDKVVNLKPDFYKRHSLLIVLIIAIGALGVFAGSGLFTKASVADFYPSSCLGTWEFTQNAQGAPETFPVGDVQISKENSAYYNGATTTEIFCGSFVPEVYEEKGDITSVALTLVWKTEDLTTTGTVPVESEIPLGPTTGENTSTPASDTGVGTSSDPAPTVPEETTSTTTSRSTVKQFIAFLKSRFLESADAEEVPTPAPEAQTPPPPAEAPVSTETTPPASPPADSVIPPETVTSPAPPTEGVPTPSETTTTPNTGETDLNTVEAVTSTTTSTEPITETSEPAPILPPSPDENFLAIEYTLDGTTWFELAKANPQNLPQLTLSLPVSSWDDLRNVQVRVRAIETSLNPIPRVLLDGMLIETHFMGDSSLFGDGTPEFSAPDSNLDPEKKSSVEQSLEAEIGSPTVLSSQFQADQWVAFKAETEGQFDVYLKNLKTNKVTQITHTPSNESEPILGYGKIVWAYATGFTGSEMGEIFAYDIMTGKTSQITKDEFVDQLPRFEDKTIVWEKIDAAGKGHLYRMNIDTGSIERIGTEEFTEVLLPPPPESESITDENQ